MSIPIEIYTVLEFHYDEGSDGISRVKQYGSYRHVDDAYLELFELLESYRENRGIRDENLPMPSDLVFTRIASLRETIAQIRHEIETVKEELSDAQRVFDREILPQEEEEIYSAMRDLESRGIIVNQETQDGIIDDMNAKYQAKRNSLTGGYETRLRDLEQEYKRVAAEGSWSLYVSDDIKFKKINGKWYMLGGRPLSKADYRDFFSDDEIEVSASLEEGRKYGTRYFIIKTRLH